MIGDLLAELVGELFGEVALARIGPLSQRAVNRVTVPAIWVCSILGAWYGLRLGARTSTVVGRACALGLAIVLPALALVSTLVLIEKLRPARKNLWTALLKVFAVIVFLGAWVTVVVLTAQGGQAMPR